jgi:hypothetical protein
MFTSPDTVVFMRCGHSIHNKCFFEYSKTSYRCPICSRSITNMETQFRNLDRTIRAQPMPPEFQDTRALVYCNDCSAKSSVPYHWLGLKCDVFVTLPQIRSNGLMLTLMYSCDSYNTAQLQLINGSDTNALSAGAIAAAAAAASAAGASTSSLPQVPVDEVMPASTVPQNSASEDRPAEQTRENPGEQSSTLSPYSLSQRAGRSVSSLIGNYFGTSPRVDAETPTSPSAVMVDDDDNDSVDFWGGESPRDHTRGVVDVEENSDSSDDDEDIDMVENEGDDELDEDEDDEDHMEIFGHR